MGNSSSSGRAQHEDTVDFGYLTPQGVCTGPKDWNHAIVTQLIAQRRLAPFYRPLEDYEDDWDDEQILAARKELPHEQNGETMSRVESSHSKGSVSKRSSAALKEVAKPEAAVYRGAVECPICFLYYPPNINRSRCCDHPICTECFVQIKRAEPTATHLVSEPAACPYCVQDNFGVVYTPPPWRVGINSDGQTPPAFSDSPRNSSGILTEGERVHKRRQKSFGHDSPEVVTIDQIRPDWEAKLATVRATVARRANRRIVMRQVGDRLIPVGVTSGRVHTLDGEEQQQEGSGGRRRRRGHGHNPHGMEGLITGPDLEELMVMEAMRLSLLEHEEQQRKEAEERRKRGEAESHSSAGELSSNAVPTPSPQPSFTSQSTLQSPPTQSSTPSHPPPFSTLNAILTSASTANAVLGGGHPIRQSDPPRQSIGAAALASASTAGAIAGRPSVESSASSSSQHPAPPGADSLSPGPAISPDAGSSRPPLTSQSSSTASAKSYDVLPSSPGSTESENISHQPLITTNTNATATPKTPAQQDYFSGAGVNGQENTES